MISRRHLLAAAGAAGGTCLTPVRGRAAGLDGTAVGMDARLVAMLDRHAGQLAPQDDEDGRIADHSLAGRAREREANAARLAELATLDRAALSPAATLDFDTARFVYAAMAEQYGRYGFSDLNLRPSPYVVSQMNGAYYWLPSGIAARAGLAGGGEALAGTLETLARALDDERDRIDHDAGLGVVPPGFILDKTMAQIGRLRDAPAAENPLFPPATSALSAADRARAEAVFRERVVPALSRQMETLAALRPRATQAAGVWALPDGEAYYASALRSNTTAAYAPGELHRLGLQWVAEITTALDARLAALGSTQGSVGERVAALDRDPRFLLPDSDAGRQAILDDAAAGLAKVRARLPLAFGVIADDPVTVRRVPAAVETGAPGGSYSPGVGGGPGVISMNLRRVEDNALWRLPTLLHHEGVPGHHFQASVLGRTGDLSRFRRAVRFSAWTEGWALYAEQLADEIGVYDDDPFGRIGFLQAQLFRACRVVVDTGIHHARWTREAATEWMMDNAGEPAEAAQREIDRYCVYPGQACSFRVGQQQILASRERARAALGDRFDVRAYNDLVLRSGPLPMDVLDALVMRWTADIAGRTTG